MRLDEDEYDNVSEFDHGDDNNLEEILSGQPEPEEVSLEKVLEPDNLNSSNTLDISGF